MWLTGGGGFIRPNIVQAALDAGHEVVTDRDAVPVAGQDDAHVLRALAVRDLRGLRVDEVRMAAKLRHARFE